VTGVEEGLFRAVAVALEMIPRKLVQNAAGNAIRALSALRVR
jgi:chaperonin GroEL (HSP60 family)